MPHVRLVKVTLLSSPTRWSKAGSWTRAWCRGHSSRPLARSVRPPVDQGWSWWAWHIAGGQSQPTAVHPPSRRPRATRWALVNRRWSQADVEHLGGTAEDRGDDAGLAGPAPRLADADRFAGVEPGPADAGGQCFVGEVDHHLGVDPAHRGQDVGREHLEELAERLSESLRRGPPGLERAGSVLRGDVLGGGQGEQRTLEHGGLRLGERGAQEHRSLPVAGQGQAALLGGLTLGGLDRAALVLLADCRREAGQDPLAEDAQRSRIVIGAIVDENLLGLRDQVGREVLGQVVEGADDDDHLVDVGRAALQCGAHPVPPLVQGSGERYPSERAGAGLPRGLGPPSAGRGGTGRVLDVHRLGMRGVPQLEGGDLRSQGGQLDQGLACHHGVDCEGRTFLQGGHLGAQVAHHLGDGASRSSRCRGGHGPIQAATTDSPSPFCLVRRACDITVR